MTINGIRFESQEAAIKYTRRVLTELEPTGRVTEAVEGWDYLNALIQRHEKYESKRGAGIAAIVIGRDTPNRAIAFRLERVDGSVEDISWIHCVKASAPTPYQKLLSAMRFAIRDHQKAQFRQNAEHAGAVCGICLKPIRPSEAPHVDHEPRSGNWWRSSSRKTTRLQGNSTAT